MLFQNPLLDFQRQLLAIAVHNGNHRFFVIMLLTLQLRQQVTQRFGKPACFFYYLYSPFVADFQQQLDVQHGSHCAGQPVQPPALDHIFQGIQRKVCVYFFDLIQNHLLKLFQTGAGQ
ncbi:hypothetical protein D3C75_933720 [compost metagenome]